MASVRRFDHVGITVGDLAAATAFFVSLGLELEGDSQIVEGHFVSTVIGIEDAKVEIVMLTAPDGGTKLELSTFLNPVTGKPAQSLMSDDPGLRNICFEVDDLHATVERLAADGFEVVGGIADYEGVYRMCYVRGPEEILVSLAQDLR